jgi:cell division inhibitor SulA
MDTTHLYKCAVNLAHQGIKLFSVDIDKTEGTAVLHEACFVLALAGERDEALLLLEKLLAMLSYHKRWYLYLDPRWDFSGMMSVLINWLNRRILIGPYTLQKPLKRPRDKMSYDFIACFRILSI